MSVRDPFIPQESSSRFYVPPTIQSDFSNFQDTEVPEATFTFEILENWYDQFEEGYKKTLTRGEVFPINWKSNFANSDNGVNFRTDFREKIRKGDMLIREDGVIYLLTWTVNNQINNQPTQAQICNSRQTVRRFVHEKTDASGYQMEPAGYNTIVDNLPCSIYRYDGRPDYSTANGTAGVIPDAQALIQVQYNPQTYAARINDEFTWGLDTYRIVDIDYTGLNIGNEYGVLKWQAKKVAGGDLRG